jgi:hypothetical protein
MFGCCFWFDPVSLFSQTFSLLRFFDLTNTVVSVFSFSLFISIRLVVVSFARGTDCQASFGWWVHMFGCCFRFHPVSLFFQTFLLRRFFDLSNLVVSFFSFSLFRYIDSVGCCFLCSCARLSGFLWLVGPSSAGIFLGTDCYFSSSARTASVRVFGCRFVDLSLASLCCIIVISLSSLPIYLFGCCFHLIS